MSTPMEASATCPHCAWIVTALGTSGDSLRELVVEDLHDHLVRRHGLTSAEAQEQAARLFSIRASPSGIA